MRLNERFNENRRHMNENDLHIWRYISAHHKACAGMSIEALGKACNVSRTTILRFAQKLNLAGFSELKLLLKLEDDADAQPDQEIIERTCQAYCQMMDDIRQKDCTGLFELLDRAENLYVFSSGMVQDSVARELRRIFMQADKWFFQIQQGSEAGVLLQNISPRDMVVILSFSGESPAVVKLAQGLKVRGVPMTSITLEKENTLAQLSDQRFYICSATLGREVYGVEYKSTTSFFILIELLMLKYLEYRRRKEAADEAGNAHRAKLP